MSRKPLADVLGKVIRLTPGHQARVEEKPEVRKAGGVYTRREVEWSRSRARDWLDYRCGPPQ